jgi:two-component system NarL family sensor kinase
LTGPRLAGDAEHEVQLLSRVIDTISAGLDLDRMLQGVATLVTETTQTDVCFVHLLDERGRTLQLRGATPPFDGLVGKIELGLGEGVSGWVASHGEPVVLVDDKTADPRYRYIPALRGEEFTSMLSVPVVTPLGHLIGVLNVHTRLRREFAGADVELLRSVAGLVAGAIENARLHTRLAEREEALEQFVEWQEHESRRLAGEIHDGISQRIVSLFFHLSAAADAIPDSPEVAAEQVARAQELAGAALDETRSAIAGLRPPVLDDLGLAASLESLGHSFPGLDVRVEAVHCLMAEHVEAAVYRTAQEALQNAAKHADARSVRLRLYRQRDRVLLEVSDDGVGFDVTAASRTSARAAGGPLTPTGFGLSGMRERAELLGGKLELSSAPGRGSTVRLAIPFLPRTQAAPQTPAPRP